MSKKNSQSGLFEGFDDKVTTTLDPCDDIETAAEEASEDMMDDTGLPDFDPCSECGRTLTRLADWIPPPATKEAAWEGWVRTCVATESSTWQWCPRTGWLTAHLRLHWPQDTRTPPPRTARTQNLDLTSQTADTAVGYH